EILIQDQELPIRGSLAQSFLKLIIKKRDL
ncbi:hypothetical protein MNBD_GAMMA01-133, partial [hydrothermal vent metagenome]